jgi:hypothetical protein
VNLSMGRPEKPKMDPNTHQRLRFLDQPSIKRQG